MLEAEEHLLTVVWELQRAPCIFFRVGQGLLKDVLTYLG